MPSESISEKIVVLSGGTGTPKLLKGLTTLVKEPLKIICNTGDDYIFYGLYISPDVDAVIFTLANILSEKGWGIHNESYQMIKALKQLLKENVWFKVGDQNLAFSIFRTNLIRNHALPLIEVTKIICQRLHISDVVLPMTNDRVSTYFTTSRGDLHLEEYYLKYNGKLASEKIFFKGIEKASVPEKVKKAIKAADRIIIGPSNPITSIGPILAVPEMKTLIRESSALKICISPFIGNQPFSGPAASYMKIQGFQPGIEGFIEIYKDIVDVWIVDSQDKTAYNSLIESVGKPYYTSILLQSFQQQRNLAQFCLQIPLAK